MSSIVWDHPKTAQNHTTNVILIVSKHEDT